jgi:hypothetical protein
VANVARNEHTGDAIRSKPPGSTYGDNYDNIFRKPKLELPGEESKGTPQIVMGYPPVTTNQSMESTGEWDETRIDTIGSNGNEGLHYLH